MGLLARKAGEGWRPGKLRMVGEIFARMFLYFFVGVLLFAILVTPAYKGLGGIERTIEHCFEGLLRKGGIKLAGFGVIFFGVGVELARRFLVPPSYWTWAARAEPVEGARPDWGQLALGHARRGLAWVAQPRVRVVLLGVVLALVGGYFALSKLA